MWTSAITLQNANVHHSSIKNGAIFISYDNFGKCRPRPIIITRQYAMRAERDIVI